MKNKETFQVEGKKLTLTHLDKIYFPDIGGTKAELIDYYIRMSPYIIPYLKGRPFSMLHYPDGINGKTFFSKAAARRSTRMAFQRDTAFRGENDRLVPGKRPAQPDLYGEPFLY